MKKICLLIIFTTLALYGCGSPATGNDLQTPFEVTPEPVSQASQTVPSIDPELMATADATVVELITPLPTDPLPAIIHAGSSISPTPTLTPTAAPRVTSRPVSNAKPKTVTTQRPTNNTSDEDIIDETDEEELIDFEDFDDSDDFEDIDGGSDDGGNSDGDQGFVEINDGSSGDDSNVIDIPNQSDDLVEVLD